MPQKKQERSSLIAWQRTEAGWNPARCRGRHLRKVWQEKCMFRRTAIRNPVRTTATWEWLLWVRPSDPAAQYFYAIIDLKHVHSFLFLVLLHSFKSTATKSAPKRVETKFHENINSGFIKRGNNGSSLFPKVFALSQMSWEMERAGMLTKCRWWLVMTGTVRAKVKGSGSSKGSDKGPGLGAAIWDHPW